MTAKMMPFFLFEIIPPCDGVLEATIMARLKAMLSAEKEDTSVLKMTHLN